MSKSSLPQSTLYRGMTKEAARNLFPNGEINVGQKITDKAYVSTSKSSGEAYARGLGGIVLKIETSEGAHGIDMSEHARAKSEQEVLLPRDAEMEVTRIVRGKSVGSPVVVTLRYSGK